MAKTGMAYLYPDASVTTRCAAIAVAYRQGDSTKVVVKDSIGWSSTCSVLTTEIAAISTALDYIQDSFEPDPSEFPFEAPHLRVTLFSDSQHALEAIKAGNSARTGRALLQRITDSFYALQEKEIEVEFR
jgi:ribonuclease HI